MFPPESYPNRVYVKVLDGLISETAKFLPQTSFRHLGVEMMRLEGKFKAR
jgi:hypothetical protein